MIDRFGTLFVGTVEHAEIGFSAPAVMDRRYSPRELAQPLLDAVRLAESMDACGFDTLWIAEHHFQPEGYECVPNALMLATHLAGRTNRLRFGCGFNILPNWHPLRLAEDYATADILTGGRVRLGIGRGYHSRELEMFGAPFFDAELARDRFEEYVDVLMLALHGESWEYRGEHLSLPPEVEYRGDVLHDLTVVPQPIHPVECWQPVVSASDRGLDFMMRHGIRAFIGGGASSGGVGADTIERWHAKQRGEGRDVEIGHDTIVGLTFILADTEREAIEIGRPILEEYQKMFAPLGFAGAVTDEQLRLLASPATAHLAEMGTVEEAIASGAWVCGPPERMIEAIDDVQTRFPGMREMLVGQPVGVGPSFVIEQLERFAAEVMPHFAGQR